MAPASREAVQVLVQTIITNDQAQYTTAIHRVEQEGSTATLDRIDSIVVAGDTAVVRGSFTMRAFTFPPKVIDGTNEAVRESGIWKDCTPSRRP